MPYASDIGHNCSYSYTVDGLLELQAVALTISTLIFNGINSTAYEKNEQKMIKLSIQIIHLTFRLFSKAGHGGLVSQLGITRWFSDFWFSVLGIGLL